MRMADHVWNLRSRRCFGLLRTCLVEARERFGMRLIEFSVLGNHLHLIVEPDSHESLSRGMQGLSVRVAKALNRLMQREGSVLADHYHSRLLETPTELVNAIAYVLGNSAHHYGGDASSDPFSSANCARGVLLVTPVGWLLRVGWRRAKRRLPDWMMNSLRG